MGKTRFKDIALLLLVIPVAVFMLVLTFGEVLSPFLLLAHKLDIMGVGAWAVALGWLFWLIASILTAIFLSKDNHETLTCVFGVCTAILSGILLNIVLIERAPILCGIISLLYMGGALFYRWYQDNKR